MSIQSINPATGFEAYSFPSLNEEELEEYLNVSKRSFEIWSRTSFSERSELILNVAQILEKKKSHLARLMAEEMGKLYASGIAEIEKCIYLCRYFADKAEDMLQDTLVSTEARKSYISYRPLGIVLTVMPWNFPFWQVLRCAIPAIIAGNTVLLKHSSLVPACALEIEKIFKEANAPVGVFKTLLIHSDQTEKCIAHDAVSAVSFTGSTEAGKIIASLAGKYLKKCVLELGGSDPYIVLKDADISQAVKICVKSRITNSGQSCIAAKRFIIDHTIYDVFLKKFVEEMDKLVMGFPMAEPTNIGPMASLKLRDELHTQVLESVKLGAKIELGGKIPHNAGAFYSPTVLSNVQPGMPAFNEELFGPVAALIKAEDEVDAIMLANDSVFGLGAAIFSRDIEYAEKVGKELIEAGSVFINEAVRSDPRLPFGGIKMSGFGRELSSFGIKEFCNIKTVYVA
ncbi:MAG TPA: NAD-dependent succinate-semialdehyde dehydrogenase [Chitinophagales bacterium]|nr:NAD-dependent succinate-semialdehyde dehydrogenase [Chitinophagales bacterium]